jgi:uncharacterized protein (TIGR03437 family)
MRFAGFTLALAGIFAGDAHGQAPTINAGGIVNNFSNTLPGLPNYGIAEGSIFSIYGTNFSSTNVGGPLPLQTTVGGVSLSVKVNGTTTSPLIYFVSPTQINAVLPSATPVGTGTITVTTSAGTSAAVPIQVVESDFGLLTTNYGSGPAQGYDASINPSNQYVLFNFSEAVNPGDTVELWGSGLGPVPGDATGVAVTPTAVVYIGGVQAKVAYAGRSSYPGLDQINVVIPSGVSGCYVSVVVQTGSFESNFGTLPVAASGRTCSDATNPLTTLLGTVSQSGSVSIGLIGLSEATSQGIDGIGGGTTENGFGAFFKITYTQLNSGASPSGTTSASLNSCVVNFYNTTSPSGPITPFKFTYLNAGPDVNIVGPLGTIAMPLTSEDGIDIYATPTSDTSFIPSTGGSFSFNNGSGGPDVGPFTATLNLSSPFTWSNMSSISTVTRSNGLTINWTGGDPSSYVGITGTSFGPVGDSTTDFVVGDFSCEAPTSAGTFTVPPAVLLSLPPSSTLAGFSASSLSVSNVSAPATFTATGLNLGLVVATFEDTITVTYQ